MLVVRRSGFEQGSTPRLEPILVRLHQFLVVIAPVCRPQEGGQVVHANLLEKMYPEVTPRGFTPFIGLSPSYREAGYSLGPWT